MSTKVVAKVVDPLALPADPSQCVHVERIYSEDHIPGRQYERCTATANPRVGRHGWLCEEHSAKVDEWFRLNSWYRNRLSPDDEIIDSIIKTDTRAFQRGTIVEVRHGRASIIFLEGVVVH
jgi:hypothetical protein